MSRPRNRAASLGRLFDAASQPLYILDEDRRIVFGNAAFRRWLGADADEVIGRRCAYHSTPGLSGPDALAAALCPPPAAFSGEPCQAVIVCSGQQGASRRRAAFLPLGDVAELIAIVAVVDDVDLAEDESETVREDARANEPQALHEILRQFHQQQAAEYSFDRLVGTSPGVCRARSQAALAAAVRSTVTVVGPKGSGKERLARTIHFAAGAEEAGTIVPLDCAVLGGDLVRSTAIALANQDPETDRPGRNTLLLSEADTIGPDAQAELARVFFQRPFPLRIIATSTRRLVELVGLGTFDEKLGLGLSTLEIELPALAECVEDLPVLTQMFVEEINATGEKQLAGAASETLDMLAAYAWPGNVEELGAAIVEAHDSADGPEIQPSDLPRKIHLALEAEARPRRGEVTIQLDEYLAEIERELIQRAMSEAKGNKTKAASLLGLNRPRLYRRLVQLGLVEEESGETGRKAES